jgi:hypothetical protein
MSPQWVATGTVDAPVDAVFAALLAVGPAAGTPPGVSPDPDGVLRYQAPIGDYTADVEVDPNRHTLAVQGHWWYRGVYAVTECPRGSLITYQVHNIATRGRWAVPLMQRRLPQRMRRDLAALVQVIGRHLDDDR